MLILKVFLCAYNFRKWQEKHVFVFSGLLQNIKMTKNAFNKVAPQPPPPPLAPTTASLSTISLINLLQFKDFSMSFYDFVTL